MTQPPAEKAAPAEVGEMFSAIARRYDTANRVLSFGIDCLWRRRLISRITHAPGARVLDLCTGTADLAILADRQGWSVSGVDISHGMLRYAKAKLARCGARICLVHGDGLRLPFCDAAFDAVMVAFGVRNLSSLEAGLCEMRRVLRPHGELLVLEFGAPRNGLWRRLYHFYLKHILPYLGGWLTGRREAYRYLETTICTFPSGADFAAVLEKTGFEVRGVEPLSGGIAYLYTAKCPA